MIIHMGKPKSNLGLWIPEFLWAWCTQPRVPPSPGCPRILSPQVEGQLGVKGKRGGVGEWQSKWNKQGKLPFWRLMTGAANMMGGGSRRKGGERETKGDRQETAQQDRGQRQTQRQTTYTQRERRSQGKGRIEEGSREGESSGRQEEEEWEDKRRWREARRG